jgi:energy-coupling factor transporter ATP-binding protein EcfA2
MLSFVHQYIEKIDLSINPEKNVDENNSKPLSSLQTSFQLPIRYLTKNVYPLNPVVSNDLELLGRESNESENNDESSESIELTREKEKAEPAARGMYEYLFNPQNPFALETIPLWNAQYTTDVSFLTDSQTIIQDLEKYKSVMVSQRYRISYDKLMEIWKSTREDPRFLERYTYIEWEFGKQLNTSPLFLQSFSLANMISPVVSFLLPILFLILPFLILKIQGIPISVEVYVGVLQDIAKHHFIGKALSSMNHLDIQNVAYLIFMVCFYFYQIYQNVTTCMRFYSNIREINTQLYEIQNYLDYTVQSMKAFLLIIEKKESYLPFRKDLIKHCNVLMELRNEFGNIQPFSPSIFKLTEIGDLLKCYYILYSRDDYASSLQYSFGFEGYINNLLGLYENIMIERISCAAFDSSLNTVIEDQYYPPHMGLDYVVNNCKFDKNMVITGPNASGKTTFLKTTMINVIFTQQTGFGFYKKCILNPYTHIHSYLNIPDTSERDSLFQAESRRCKEIIDIIHSNENEVDASRHLCTFDELYSGTNPEEASKSAYAFLLYLAKFKNVDFILTTHYVSICHRLKKSERICNWKMEAICDAENGDIQYTYKIKKGVSKIQGALKVLKDMKYPEEIIDNISKW